jgi:BON domain
MRKMCIYGNCRSAIATLAVAMLGGAIALSTPARAAAQQPDTQPGDAPRVTTGEHLRTENLSVHSEAKHHYNSPAERAEDALLIVKVKAAIADAGLAEDQPLTVDADHGRVTLTGVLASHDDLNRTLALVSQIDGVKGVTNRLTEKTGD